MDRWLALMVAFFVASCSSPTAAAIASPSPSASSTPTAAISHNVPRCRIPAMQWSYPNPETQGGFIDTASGEFTTDPESVMVVDVTRALLRTPSQPYLYGMAGDSAFASASYGGPPHRWLPVPPQYMAPDGKSYAYAVQGQGIHVVDVASASDLVVSVSREPSANAHYGITGYLRHGIYLTEWGPTGGAGIGLWRLDPATGAVAQVSTDAPGTGVFIGETADTGTLLADAWWTEAGNPNDAAHVFFEYLTGAAGQHGEHWFQRPGFRASILGVDESGRTVVLAESPTSIELWLLSTPNSSTELHAMANGTGSVDRAFKTAVADRGGWWIGSKTGVFFASATGLTQVSKTAAVVVGGCV